MLAIRKMKYDDLYRVSDIEKKIFSSPWSYNSFREIIKYEYNHYFAIVKNNEIIGYFGMQIIIDECQIHNIGILEEERGKGYGKRAFEFIIDYCNDIGINNITLEVRQGNVEAIGLYEKYGFKKMSKIKDYYKNPVEDGFLMRLDLGERFE
ncbi:ribosomal protein S18-alanine N-acetyltransferase [Miniphocaeibacter massiliensis]|uniref:ribosomal protein S18-alanine N-acetyltransferase n=1 Tax=Miniphocaeibacter massiliensis TaxID=2041841 RepID=UPI000C079D74|nr:ribosomal protein S18-alanine N-acetyltransferase [Miniphocaeibacter massiliensis]